jgi:hypothetical protein
MMGVEEPETCWETQKRQVINLWSGCIWLANLYEWYWELLLKLISNKYYILFVHIIRMYVMMYGQQNINLLAPKLYI